MKVIILVHRNKNLFFDGFRSSLDKFQIVMNGNFSL